MADESLPQRQDSLEAQLRDVATLANRAGYCDAADWITRQLKMRSLMTPAMRQNTIDFIREFRDEPEESA